MSKIISFRLDIDNPREAQALEVLQTFRDDGYSIRHIVTEALLNLDVLSLSKDSSDRGELVEIMVKINYLLSQLEFFNEQTFGQQGYETKLPDTFLSAIQKSVKSGVKLD